MKLEDMILVSVDDHICEPAGVFDSAPTKWRDQMPQVVCRNGIDAWEFQGKRMANLGLNAVVGRRPEEYGLEPMAFDQLRKGCYDVHARVADMNANGMLASLNFAQMASSAGQALICKDLDLSYVCIQAYNDWHIDEWCGAYPERFIPQAIMPLWDMDLAVAEAQRIKAKGCNAISLLPVPNREGFQSWNSGYWDPLLAAAEDLELVINLHIADAHTATPSPESPVDVFITNLPVSLFMTASDLLWSPILRRHPNLKFALSEGGAGWVGHLKERADFTYKHHSAWTNQDFGDMLPSEVFDRHFYTCFIEDAFAIQNRAVTGINNMMWECDYPHSDCTWPRSPEGIFPSFSGCTDDEINKITHLNALRLYKHNPFKTMDRVDCTVGALRALAKNVDLSYLDAAAGGVKPSNEGGKVPSMGEMAQRLNEAYSLTV